jgi:ubiquinone/menaquinone biosynthesis C-methylase UbiE
MTVFNLQEANVNHLEYKNHQSVVTAKQLEDMHIVDEDADDLVPDDLPQFLLHRAARNLGALAGHINKDSRILDIGCRTGIFLLFLKKNGFENVKGIEIHDKSVEIAKKRGLDAYNGDAHKLPFKDNSFDAISCTQVIEHAYNPQTVLKEMSRVLTSDGVLWIDAPLEGVTAYDETFNHAGHHCFWTSPEEFAAFLNTEFQPLGHQIYLYPPDKNGKVWAQGMGFLCKQK